jgi:gliding motility-associated-like protein
LSFYHINIMKKLVTLFVLLFSLISQKSFSQACLTDYRFRVPVTIINTNGVLSNFQVKIILNTQSLITAGKMRIDGGDVRFTDGSGNPLSYWFDPNTLNTTTTEYWVKITSVPVGNSTIFVFYGNSTVPTVSSGDATFELFDDFTSSAIDLLKWTRCGDISNVTLSGGFASFTTVNATNPTNNGLIISNNNFTNSVIIEADVVSSTEGKSVLGMMTSTSLGYATTMERTTGVDVMKLSRITDDVASCQTFTDILPTQTPGSLTGVWSFRWPLATSQTIGWPGGVLTATYTDAVHSAVFGSPKNIVLGSSINTNSIPGSMLVDWIRVRKLTTTDPTFALGGEQEFPVDPNPTNGGPYCGGETIIFNSTVYAGVNYVWKNPLNATFSTFSTDSIVGSIPGNTGTYTLEVSVPGCAPVIRTTYVDVSNASDAGTTSGSATVCSGANAGVVSVAGITGNVIRWEMANNAGGPWFTISNTATTMTYSNLIQTTLFRPVVKTSACVEDVGTAAVITVDNATVGGFVIGGTSVCSGTNNGLLNLVFYSGNINKWQFSIDGGTFWTDIISNSNSYSFSNLTQTTMYRAEIQSGTCSAQFSAPATVIVNPLPVPSFTNTTVCEGIQTAFTNTTTIASGSINNYQWDFGNSGSSISANPNYLYSASGTYFVGLTAVSNAGCSATGNALVTVNAKPNVTFTASDVCQGSVTTFQAIVTVPGGGSITNYDWDLDDGSTSNLPLFNYTYASTGVYDVLLVATTNLGCIDSVRNDVEVAAPVNVNFVIDSVCLGQSITFINTSTTSASSVNYTWDFGNGATSTLNSPIYTYPAIGTYTVTLQAQVASSSTSCVSSLQQTVVIYEVPATNFSLLNVCLIDSAEFSNLTFYTGNPTDVSYSWNFGDAATSTAINPYHSYGSPGNFNVQLTASTIQGCSQSNTQLISIYPMPVSNYTFADVCLEDNMIFTSTSSVSTGTLSYAWDFGDASTNATQNPIHLYNADGSYQVQLVVTTNNNCRDTIIKTVVVKPLPFVDFINAAVCDGQASAFTEATSISLGTVVSFDWDFGDGSSSTSASASHQYLNPGTYPVTLVATSDLGCVNDTIRNVTVDPLPLANFTPTDACLGAANIFTNSSTISNLSPLTYAWDFGDAATSTLTSPNHIYAFSGLYNVKLVVTSGAGCQDSVVKVTEVYALPIVNAGNDTSISRGDEVQLNAYDPAGISYSWSPVDGLSSSAIPNPIARPLDTTTYILTMTDVYGCQNTDDITIDVINDFKLLIHNVITPDGNGQNDVWYITNIDFYPEATVQLFNRWGEMMFETLAYQNDWNGVFGTDQLPDGTYYYIITFPDTDIHYKGAVTLLRNK